MTIQVKIKNEDVSKTSALQVELLDKDGEVQKGRTLTISAQNALTTSIHGEESLRITEVPVEPKA